MVVDWELLLLEILLGVRWQSFGYLLVGLELLIWLLLLVRIVYNFRSSLLIIRVLYSYRTNLFGLRLFNTDLLMYILFFFSNFLQISTLNFYMRLIPTISVNIMPYMSQLAPMTLMTCPRSISLNPIKPQTAKTVTTNIAIDLIQQLINFFNTKVLYGGMFRYLLFLWLFGLQISWWWVLDVGVFIFLLCLHLFMLLYIHVYVYYGYI